MRVVAPAVGAVLKFERDAEVLEHRVPRQQRALLKHERDVARQRSLAPRVSPTVTPPDRRRDQAADDVEQRALPAARRSEQTHELAALNFERDVVERLRVGRAVRTGEQLRDAIDGDRSRHGGTQILTGTNCELSIAFASSTVSASPRSFSDCATTATACRIPRAVARHRGHVVIVEPADDGFRFAEHRRDRLHRLGLVRAHVGDGLEPTLEEPRDGVGVLLDYIVGGEDHVRQELRHEVTERLKDLALALRFEFVTDADILHAAGDLAGAERRDARFRRAHRHRIDAVGAPALALRERVHEPVGQRAGGGDAELLPFEVGDGLDLTAVRDHDRHIGRRSVHRRNRDARHAFGVVTHRRTAAKPEIDLIRGHRALYVGVAFEGRNVELEVELVPDVRVVADFEHGERERGADRASDANRVRARGRTAARRAREYKRDSEQRRNGARNVRTTHRTSDE